MAAPLIKSVGDLISSVEPLGHETQILFRGQDCDEPLLPKIARKNPNIDTKDRERKMLEELKRRSAQDPLLLGRDDWDRLVYAQHYGMATRLLDWTTNPLIALWFAAIDQKQDRSGYMFMLFIDEELLLDKQAEPDPFSIGKTRVLKPNLNNPRISAQSGWFTIHRYSKKAGRFVDLHKNRNLKTKVLMKGVPGKNKSEILRSLDKLGVNYESLFPGIEGTCRHVNWYFEDLS
jgi:hypothetical protein